MGGVAPKKGVFATNSIIGGENIRMRSRRRGLCTLAMNVSPARGWEMVRFVLTRGLRTLAMNVSPPGGLGMGVCDVDEGLTHPRYECVARKGLGRVGFLFLGLHCATPQAMESHPCRGSNRSVHFRLWNITPAVVQTGLYTSGYGISPLPWFKQVLPIWL